MVLSCVVLCCVALRRVALRCVTLRYVVLCYAVLCSVRVHGCVCVVVHWSPSVRLKIFIDPFPKRHRLVHNRGFPKFKALHFSQNMVNSTEISQTLVTRYNLPDHKVSNQFKS